MATTETTALECMDAANAAARLTKALRASRVLNTSAPIAKARSNRRATTETTALEWIINPVSKSGDKYSALELSINHIYKIPCPREILVLNARSAPSTPVRTITPTKPVERAAKTIKIDLEKD